MTCQQHCKEKIIIRKNYYNNDRPAPVILHCQPTAVSLKQNKSSTSGERGASKGGVLMA